MISLEVDVEKGTLTITSPGKSVVLTASPSGLSGTKVGSALGQEPPDSSGAPGSGTVEIGVTVTGLPGVAGSAPGSGVLDFAPVAVDSGSGSVARAAAPGKQQTILPPATIPPSTTAAAGASGGSVQKS